MLVAQFGTQFATSWSNHLTSVALVNIRQDKREPLRAFVEHFSKIALNIQTLDAIVAMHHLITTLRLRPFMNSL